MLIFLRWTWYKKSLNLSHKKRIPKRNMRNKNHKQWWIQIHLTQV